MLRLCLRSPQKTFYVNQATRAAQWADPRKVRLLAGLMVASRAEGSEALHVAQRCARAQAAVAAQNSFVAFVVIIVAVLALFIGGAIYVAYLVVS